MITKTVGYQSSDGTVHSSLERAQQVELENLLRDVIGKPTPQQGGATFVSSVVAEIIARGDKVVDILTMKPNSLPRARSINGGRKNRKPKHIAAQNTLPLDTTEPPRAA